MIIASEITSIVKLMTSAEMSHSMLYTVMSLSVSTNDDSDMPFTRI